MKNYLIIYIIGVSYVIMFASCRKYLDVGGSPTQLTGEEVFNNNLTATAAQLAIYAQMEQEGLALTMQVNGGLSSDEYINFSTTPDAVGIATNNITPENGVILTMWTRLYKYIYQANAILEGVGASTSLSTAVKQQLEGEALFVRAFVYYYAATLFGNIPFHVGTDASVNASASQQTEAEIFSRTIADLERAHTLLSEEYLAPHHAPTSERVRPNRFAAAALLARMHLYLGNWQQAENYAGQVIASSKYALVMNLDNVFLRNSSEAIWQFQAIVPRYNSHAGGLIPVSGIPNQYSIGPSLTDSFEAGDLRKTSWMRIFSSGGQQYYYPAKFKVGQNAPAITEYSMVLRLAEMYLVRAEAKARLGKVNEALSDLNPLRQRAGLPALAITDQGLLLQAIGKERKLELFAEFGDRWIDLRRTRQADLVMPSVKGSSWSTHDQLYPIPQVELDRNSRLQQNTGY